MKKSLIALAVLAASGAAMAQSSVTVYGRVDLSVGSLIALAALAATVAVRLMNSRRVAPVEAEAMGGCGNDLAGTLCITVVVVAARRHNDGRRLS